MQNLNIFNIFNYLRYAVLSMIDWIVLIKILNAILKIFFNMRAFKQNVLWNKIKERIVKLSNKK